MYADCFIRIFYCFSLAGHNIACIGVSTIIES